MKKVIIVGVLIVVVAAVIFAGLNRKEKTIKVQTEKLFKADVVETVTGNGKIYPVTEVNISAKVAGEILQLDAEEGDSISAGQLLVRLDSRQYQAMRDRQKSNIVGAKADVTLRRSELKRAKELFDKSLISKSELDIAQAQYDKAYSYLSQAEASLKEAQDALDKTILRAPMDGIIIRKNKEVGEIALGSQFQEDVILVLADLSQMEARVEVNENDIINVSLRDTCAIEIDAFPDTTFPGLVSEISNSAKTVASGTIEEVTNYQVKVRLLKKLPTFRPGMSATSDIATDRHRNVLNLPIQALTARDREKLKSGKKRRVERTPAEREADEEAKKPDKKRRKKKDDRVEIVFVVENGKAIAKPVKVGISDDNYYEVLEGLNEDQEVITGPFKVVSRTLKNEDLIEVDNVPESTKEK